tara:strand:+ start:237 stop:1532 length:1296 start_codon:yes stop_codon:yes gene_type:complete
MAINWGETAGNAWDWFNSDKSSGLRNMMGAAGQLAASKQATNRLSDLSDAAVTRIGMPTGSFYDTIKADTKFTPFSVTSNPGTVTTDSTGSAFYNLNADQTALENSLRTGGSSLVDAVLGRGGYGSPKIGPDGQPMLDAAGNPIFEDNMRSEQDALLEMLQVGGRDAAGQNYRDKSLQNYIGSNQSLTDPFDATNLATSENALFNQLQAMRQPQQLRDQLALDEKLFSQGRTGLQTAAYGGSPEQFAREQAIAEQTAQDQLMAMQQARSDAANISDRRRLGIGEARADQALASGQILSALQQQMQEKEVGGDLATRFLESSYQPGQELVGMMQPSLNLANMATTAGQQLGGYGRDLAGQELTYDLGTEQLSADIQREALNSIFGLLMNEQTNKGNVASAANAAAGRTGASTTFGYNPNNPNHDPYKPWTWI